MLAGSPSFWENLAVQVVGGILVVLVVAVFAWMKRGSLARIAERLLTSWRVLVGHQDVDAAAAGAAIELCLEYMTHLREVVVAFDGAHADDSDHLKARVRTEVLEPIRAFLPTQVGERIKIVWFRPDRDRVRLDAFDSVGHPGSQVRSLPVDASLAGDAFRTRKTCLSNDCSGDSSVRAIDGESITGSLACIPIVHGDESSGVLSIWSSEPNSFWWTELKYFEVLAAAVQGLEPLMDEGSKSNQ